MERTGISCRRTPCVADLTLKSAILDVESTGYNNYTIHYVEKPFLDLSCIRHTRSHYHKCVRETATSEASCSDRSRWNRLLSGHRSR
jgi:hypothetical protein